ncbi:MAG TPA: ornithine cyclodeaminase family protein [Bryobacteraceae bacterium]|nr:ornithine cyclodeaminase family protein [Bryobacteraceae bacterium]
MAIWLSEPDVRALLPLPELIDAIEHALAAFSVRNATQPVRTVIGIPGGVLACMPGLLKPQGALGAKLVTVCPENLARGLASHLATIVLLDPDTGQLLAMMDGRYITEMRTAAASAVAVRYLAREDSERLAIIGSGVQAASHLQSLSLVRSFREISCWSRTRANLEKFVESWSGGPYPVRAAHSAQEAMESADVIALVAAGSEPVIRDAWVKPGACIVAVGACRPNEKELQPALVARARLFVDSREGAFQESGDILEALNTGQITRDHILGELGEVVTDRRLGRLDPNDITIFKSLGMAVEDLAAAQLVYQRARHTGRGVELD